jgi:hypothetical protein
MIWQLRTYQIRPGCMEAFRALWSEHIVPTRIQLGFEVRGGWFDEGENVFVWIVGHPAPDGWKAIETAYNADPLRKLFPNDPREFVASFETRLLREA